MSSQTILIYSISNFNIEFYKKSLGNSGYSLFFAYSHPDFERLLVQEGSDLIIADLDLDNTDAITLIKEIKLLQLTKAPHFIICSTKADDFIQISALNSGADDFIDLPLSAAVFEAKIKALLKRFNNTPEKSPSPFYVDHERYKIVIGNNAYSLPRLEFKLIDLLFSNPTKIFSKDEIATEIWHNKDISSKRTIDIHIRNIRRQLGDGIIKTYRGIGYCINPNF